MQRASAATPTASPTTPDGGRPSKRQRMSTDAAVSPDVKAFQEAAAAEEAKRNAFIERAAAEAGETKWVLSVQDDKPKPTEPSLRVVNAGYGAIDSGAPISESDDEEEEQSAGMAGRRSFGKFNKTVEVSIRPHLNTKPHILILHSDNTTRIFHPRNQKQNRTVTLQIRAATKMMTMQTNSSKHLVKRQPTNSGPNARLRRKKRRKRQDRWPKDGAVEKST